MAQKKGVRAGKGAMGAVKNRREVTVSAGQDTLLRLSSSRELSELAGYLECVDCGKTMESSGLLVHRDDRESLMATCPSCKREVWMSRR
ncbi:MAG: hypothetical protein GF331_13670 [Chitinivibrionales bacterium]|nr:hypothetical protein [Chitinivibrionales bacterium]